MIPLATLSDSPLRVVAGILLRRRRMILVTAFLLTGALGLGVLATSLRYTAKAEVEIVPQEVGLVGGQAGILRQEVDQPSVQTAITAIAAQDHLRYVFNELRTDHEFLALKDEPQVGSAQPPPARWHSAAIWLHRMVQKETGRSDELTVRQLQNNLTVFQERGSHVIAVTFTAIDPQEAALIANRVASLYVQRRAEENRATTDHALTWLDERVPQVRQKIDDLEKAMLDYQAAHHLADTNGSGATDQEAVALAQQLSTGEADLAARRSHLAGLQSARAGGGSVSTNDTLDSPALADLRRQEQSLSQAEATLRTTYLAAHPKVQQVEAQLRDVRRQISQELDRTISNQQADIQTAAARVASYRDRLGTIRESSSDVRLRAMQRDDAETRQMYETLVQRQEEINQRRQSLSSDVRVLSLAWPPDRPDLANPVFFLIPGLILSLILGSLLALAMESLDRTLHGERDVFDAVGIPCIGLVPRVRRLRRQQPHSRLLANPFDPYTEAIRSLAVTLRMTDKSGGPRTLLISSSVPGEGKTTLAVSFATYLASLGRRVVLLDLDIRNPSVARAIEGTGRREVLAPAGKSGLPATTVLHSAALGFDYLPIHRPPGDPMALFADGLLERMLLQLRSEYDCVVIDSAPLLATAESRALAAMVDKVLFTVRWGSTRKDLVQSALRLLLDPESPDENLPNVAGVVVTQVNLKKHARYGYGDSGEMAARFSKYLLP